MINRREMIAQAGAGDFDPPFDRLAEAIGAGGVLALCEIAGGRRVSVPKPDALVSAIRRRLIISEHRRGAYTAEQLAERYGVCLRTVYSYIRGDSQ